MKFLVDENRENMAALRALIHGKRKDYGVYTEQKLKEYFSQPFHPDILTKAREEAPELPEIDGAGMKNNKSHRRQALL